MNIDLNTLDLTELLKRENGCILYEGSEGSIVREGCAGTVISDITDADRLCQLLKQLKLPDFSIIALKSREAAQKVQSEYGFDGCNPCSQWVYIAKEPPKWADCDIRLLTAQSARTVGEHYHESVDYVRERIAAERMWGLYEDGTLAGFIGMHSEGSIGMLEVFPEFRHKGYGYALEAYLISLHLQRGWVPYCHVIDGNEASLRLQKKLGMVCADLPAIWIWKEDTDVT